MPSLEPNLKCKLLNVIVFFPLIKVCVSVLTAFSLCIACQVDGNWPRHTKFLLPAMMPSVTLNKAISDKVAAAEEAAVDSTAFK